MQEYTKPGVFSSLSSDDKLAVLMHYQYTYENNEPDQIDDATFDSLVNIYESETGLKYSVIGAEPTGNKETLPYYMGSLDKAKGKSAEDDLRRYTNNFPGEKIIEDKIDGNSGLYVVRYINGKLIRKLYTRGNGYIGTDISHLLNYINIPIPGFDIVVRGELVLPLKEFEKYSTKLNLKNARNAGSGVINSKEINEDLAKLIKFYAYNIVDWPYDKINPENQLIYLDKLKFDTPWYIKTEKLPSIPELEDILNIRRAESPYDIDGIVISDNKKFYPIEEGKNPKSMIAFKIDVFNRTTVRDVIWEASKDGVLKPVVVYDPVNTSGITMTRASGKNAKFIIENKIGPGAEILVTRAGDVIPDIVSVITPSETLKLPIEEYDWNSNGIEFVLKNMNLNSKVQCERIEYFMTQLEIKNVGPGRITLLYNNGFDTLEKILSATVDDLSKIEGLGKKSATQIIDNIHNAIHPAPLANVMTASGVFGPGFGVKKMELVTEVYPDILDKSNLPHDAIVEMIRKIAGFDKMSETFAEKLPRFKEWLAEHPMIDIEIFENAFTGNENVIPDYIPMNGLKIVFTGFRSSELENEIKMRGGNVSTSISKNTSYLVAKDINDLKGKGEKAQGLGVPIVNVEEFKKLYKL